MLNFCQPSLLCNPPSAFNSPLPNGESGAEDSSPEFVKALDSYNIQRAVEIITERVSALDKRIQETEPFKLVKTDKVTAQKIIAELVAGLSEVAHLLLPIIPDTAAKIQSLVASNKMPGQPLFPRK